MLLHLYVNVFRVIAVAQFQSARRVYFFLVWWDSKFYARRGLFLNIRVERVVNNMRMLNLGWKLCAYQKTGTRNPSWTLLGPYKNRNTRTLVGPYKNRKTRTLAGLFKNRKTRTLAGSYKNRKTGTRNITGTLKKSGFNNNSISFKICKVNVNEM